MPNATLAGEYTFGRFRVDARARELRVDGQRAEIGGRAFDLLVALIERRQRTVSRDELFEVVWPGFVVSSNNLDVQISAVRKLLGPQAIATIPGRGYRFTALLDSEQLVAAQPAPAALGAASRAAPPTLSRLIGRESDFQAACAQLARHRLVTITGAGGIGKTMLAHHVADAHAKANTGASVVWVELAGLTEPALVVDVIAGATGVSTGAADPLRALIKALKPFDMLIALDNAEHLVDEVATVVQALVDGLPGLRVLVTSQVPLKVPAEQVYRLGALSVPQAKWPETQLPLSEALGHGAVALFVDRVQALDQRFAPDEKAIAAVIDVCRQLDGLPLAIELAAARVPALGLQGVRERLGERLRLLNTGARTAPPRHQTLRAALEWSHALLSGDEQVVFRRLGVFAGGFSLEMGEQVIGDERLDSWAVIDALAALVDRSLVAVEGGDPPRYRLLESARALALEQLAIADERDELRRRHAQAVRVFFAQVWDGLWRHGTIGRDRAVEMATADLDNLREALGWAVPRDAETAVALLPPLAMVLHGSGSAELRRAFEATEPLVTMTSVSARARWQIVAAGFWSLQDRAKATESAQRAVTLCRELGDGRLLHRALAHLAHHSSLSDDERRKLVQEARALEQADWPQVIVSLLREAEGEIELSGPNPSFETVLELMRTNVVARQQAGDSMGAHIALANVAWVEMQAGKFDDSIHHGLEFLEQWARLPESARRAMMAVDAVARMNVVGAAVLKGDVAQARAQAQAAWPQVLLFETCVDQLTSSLALMAALEGRVFTAARLLGYAEGLRLRSGSPQSAAEIRIVADAERLARERLGDAEFERLREEGAQLRDDEIPTLAFATDDSA